MLLKAIKAARRVFPEKILFKIKNHRQRRDLASFRPYTITRRAGDLHFNFYIGDMTAKRWYDYPDGLSQEMSFIRDHLVKEGMTVFDCGSHHGWTALLLAAWTGKKGRVFGFEPSRSSYDFFVRNIEMNHIKNITAIHAAVGETKRTAPLSPGSCAWIAKRSGEPVRMVALDEYRNEKPELIKIDVEGYEVSVLKGSPEILRTRPALVIEVHTETLACYGSSVEDIFRLVGPQGYRIWIQWARDQKPVAYKKEKIKRKAYLFFQPES